MAKKQEVKIKQTKGTYTVTGKVSGVDRDNFYKEGETRNGNEYARINFGVRTSPNQTVFVGAFGQVPEKVYLFSTDRELSYPDNMKIVDYSDWVDDKEELEEDGWIASDMVIALERDSKGNITNRVNTVAIDGIELLNSGVISNGDDVTIMGDLNHNTYQNRNGDDIIQTNYDIRRVYSTKNEIDFDDEDFEERAVFTQQFIYNDFEYDKKEKRVHIFGWSANYQGKLTPITLIIDPQDDEDIKAMADSVRSKALKYGQLCTVHGNIVNKAVISEDDNDDLGALTGKKQPTVSNYIRELLVLGFKSVEKGYTEEEILEALDENTVIVKNDDDDDDNDLGGLSGKSNKSKTKVDDDEDEDVFDIDEEDLPF